MTQIASPARAERIEVDHAARTRLADADYADAFRIAVAEFHPAEELARQAMESAPLPLRAIVPTAWRRVLVLRLGPLHGSSAHVLGWRIVENEPNVLVLAASGPLITARLVIGSDDQHASITTLVRYEHAAAPAVWACVGIAHRAIAPMLLNAARK